MRSGKGGANARVELMGSQNDGAFVLLVPEFTIIRAFVSLRASSVNSAESSAARYRRPKPLYTVP